ncbi:MAG TPA: ATP-binding protein [Puia sp.]|nr:ATP-binding protein [Puia sp.]
MTEDQNTEYKESWRDDYLKWICGFANAQGGKIYIGINDDMKVTGLDNFKKLMDDLPNKISAHLGLMPDINLLQKNEKYYIEIVVSPSPVPISYHGAYHYRCGSTKQELKGPALLNFILGKFGKSWDETPLKSASLSRINGNTLNTFLYLGTQCQRLPNDSANHEIETLFAKLNLMNEEGDLNHAAVLLFYEDPLKYFPTAYFKIGRFGSSDADLKFQDVVKGNIFEMADKVLEILRSKYLTSPIRYEGLLRKDELEYPETALREAILNAIVHKDYTGEMIQMSVYDDRIMLWNPGSIPDDLRGKLKDKHPSRPRNKNIAEIFFAAGYIEVWGRGILKMVEACKTAGLPEPEIKEESGGVWVTFFKDIYTQDFLTKLNLNERQIKAVLYVKANGFITNGIFQSINSIGKSVTTTDLQDLVNKKIVVQQGKAGRAVKYTLKR